MADETAKMDAMAATWPKAAETATLLLERAGGDREEAIRLARSLRDLAREKALRAEVGGAPLIAARFAEELLTGGWVPPALRQ